MTDSAAAASARLRILATSDLHTQLCAWDYLADAPSPARGLARTASLIAQARADGHACLLVDNGDFLQGSPLGDLIAAGGCGEAPHPMIAAMNHLGYDAATLGNHEFSHGLPFLNRALQEAAFPVVSANILTAAGKTPFCAPFALVTRHLTVNGESIPLRIGIIGFAPPHLVQWDHQHVAGRIVTEDIVSAARRWVPDLISAGADLVIALSHSGIGALLPYPDMENASTALSAVAGVDVLVAGHTHQIFPAAGFAASTGVAPDLGTLNGKPAVMPGFFGSHLGVIDLDLTRRDGRWQIARHSSAVWPIAERDAEGRLTALVASDPAIEAIAAPAHAATLAWARRRIGHNTAPLHSYFALIWACPSVRVVARAQADFVRRALIGTPRAGLPVLSAAAPFRAGGRGGPENFSFIGMGDLAMRHISDLYMHPNTLTAIEICGAELADWLEHSASIFLRIAPGQADQPLIDPDFPSFNFDSIEGVTYRIDLGQPPRHDLRGAVVKPAARRIVDLRFDGQPIAADARFVLATNSYRTGGSGSFAGARPDRVILATGRLNSDILLDYIVANGGIPAPPPANWAFAAMPGTSVTFESAPRAARYAADLPGLQVDPLERTPEGFRRFRLHL